ncbi:MAG: NAD-dependent epimerase/dehydratase family protein [Chitinophagales bacterium]|jgi:UDP-glucose 4-epimerase|nr:NAD-dependent epimerase/dehydratase family protein [Chitinophagales bacterium]
MQKILITGGAGFIGSSLADRLIQDPNNFVVLVDNFLTGNAQNLPNARQANWKFIRADVNDYRSISSVMSAYRFDYVFHYAAMVGVQRTLQQPVQVLNDIQGLKNLLDLCKNTGVRKIFFASSSEVYGESVRFPQDEVNTPLNSRLPYAVVKNVGEAYCTSYQKEFGLDYTIFRFFNTYGPKQSTDFVMSKFLRAALANETITIYGDGSQSRTFCYISDNIDATVKAFYNNLYCNDVMNVGNDTETPILELAQKIVAISGSKSNIIHLPPLKEGDMRRRLPHLQRMKAVLDRPLVTLEEGIQKMIATGKFHPEAEKSLG